tara:strand:+ start:222 stop:440 length:219 start_codon:yes stop_codon:yes gene_type:complete
MEWVRDNVFYIIYLLVCLGIGYLLAVNDFDVTKIFSKYSSSMECEIEKKIELGYEPDLDTQYQIMYFCRKYD